MLENLLKRRDDEEGFTLIELMVVVLIIGILVAIAVPTFLNAQNNAKSKAAQSNARSGLSAVKTVYADTETYTGLDQTALRNAEPSLGWAADSAAASTGTDVVAWAAIATDTFAIAVQAKSGECFMVKDVTAPGATGGIWYGKLDKGQDCLATTTPTAATGIVYDRSAKVGWANG